MKFFIYLILFFVVFLGGCQHPRKVSPKLEVTSKETLSSQNAQKKVIPRNVISTYPNVKPIPEMDKFFISESPEQRVQVFVSGDPFAKIINFYEIYFGVKVSYKSEALLKSKAKVYGIVQEIEMPLVAKAILGEKYGGNLLKSTDKVKLVVFTDRQSSFKVEIVNKFISPTTKQVVNKVLLGITY